MKTFIKYIWLIIFFTGNLQAEDLSCEIHYISALENISDGNYIQATAELQQAIHLAPTPSPEYLPYLYLAVASYKAEQFDISRDALIQSQVYGVAAKTEVGIEILNEYAANIMTASPGHRAGEEILPQSSMMSFADFERQNYTLSEARVELIRSSVLKRCAISSRVNKNKLPWYFHYEFGKGLMEAGDAQRAVETFVLGANVRGNSKRGKRMYGMWFIDYLPYYQIALAHTKLGNWENAHDAILTSASFKEFTIEDSDYESFVALDQLIKSNLEIDNF